MPHIRELFGAVLRCAAEPSSMLVAGGALWWFKPRAPESEPASLERMAYPLPVPEFQHEERPQLCGAVRLALNVLLDQAPHGGRFEVAALHGGRRENALLEPWVELISKMLADRQAHPALSP